MTGLASCHDQPAAKAAVRIFLRALDLKMPQVAVSRHDKYLKGGFA
jgi:hypothetical protein